MTACVRSIGARRVAMLLLGAVFAGPPLVAVSDARADGLHLEGGSTSAPPVSPNALLAGLRDAARRERPPAAEPWTGADEQALRQRASDEEILYREALFASARSKDPAVERRLRALATQLDAGQVGEDLPFEAEARRLGLDRRDLVLRRYLVESMRLALATPPASWQPSEPELQAWYEARREGLAEPARLTLTQIFLSRARRGESAYADAIALRERLERDRIRPPDAAAGSRPSAAETQARATIESLGDAFARGPTLHASATELSRSFGAGFAAAVDGAGAEGGWLGPIESPTGIHLVWIHRREPGRVKLLDEVRAAAMLALRQQEGERLFRERLDELRARYAGADLGVAGQAETAR